MTLPGAIAFRR